MRALAGRPRLPASLAQSASVAPIALESLHVLGLILPSVLLTDRDPNPAIAWVPSLQAGTLPPDPSLWREEMTTEWTRDAYSRRVQVLHWLSAALILLMIPLGFCMQGIESRSLELFAFRLHVLSGIVVLALTVLRLVWRWMDGSPEPLQDLSPLHRRMVGFIHALLYLVLAGLSISGVILLMQSGLGAILFGLSSEPIPADLGEYLPRQAHAAEARVYMALLVAHVGGVLVHQLTHGEVLARMGVHVGQAAVRQDWKSVFETAAPAEHQPDAGARRGS